MIIISTMFLHAAVNTDIVIFRSPPDIQYSYYHDFVLAMLEIQNQVTPNYLQTTFSNPDYSL
jgi:hypothetical protein